MHGKSTYCILQCSVSDYGKFQWVFLAVCKIKVNKQSNIRNIVILRFKHEILVGKTLFLVCSITWHWERIINIFTLNFQISIRIEGCV